MTRSTATRRIWRGTADTRGTRGTASAPTSPSSTSPTRKTSTGRSPRCWRDISSEAIAEARARFGPHYEHQNIFDPDDGFQGAFDFAILLETIEHVPAPA